MKWRHHTEPVEQVLPPSMDICLPEQSCAEMPESDYNEQFRPEVSEFVNDMVTMAETWGSAMIEMPRAVAERREREESKIESHIDQTDRSSRRDGSRHKDAQSVATIAWAHNAGRWMARPELDADAPRLVAITDPVDLAERMAAIGEGLQYDDEETDLLARQFKLLFIAEEIVHAQMAMVEVLDPRAFRQIFDPSAVADLPPALQRLSAMDISRDKDSIILRNARRTLEDSRTPGQQLADYLSNNHLPDNIRQIVTGIQLGAAAMGAPVCPRNDAGLCTKVLERMPIEDLPEPLKRDMAIRAGKSAQDRIAKLLQFGRTHSAPRMFDSSVVFDYSDPSDNGTVSSKKRRQNTNGHATKVDKRDISFDSLAELVEPSFHTVSVVVMGESDEPVVFNLGDDTDPESVSVAPLLETKPFKEYMDAHRGVNLSDLLAAAVRQILFRQDYKNTGGMIVPLVDTPKKVNHAGVAERLNRFSGQKTDLLGSGKVGRQTRIIFSQGTKDGVRHITIRKVTHKSDIEKGIKL